MKRILKYQLDVINSQQICTHKGFIPLHTGYQQNVLRIWMLVDDSMPECNVDVYIYGTGHPITEPEPGCLSYVGTALTPDGYFVWHVFIDLDDDKE